MFPLKVVLVGNDDSVVPSMTRQLLNVSAEIVSSFADIESTIAGLQLRHDETRLFVVHLADGGELAALRNLTGVFPGRPVILVVDAKDSASLLVHAMREGATQIVTLPLETRDFQEALNAVALQFGHSASRSIVVGFTGAHGGVGTTTVAVNFAYEVAQQYHIDTLLVEMNPRVGVFPSILNIRPQWSIRELLEMSDRLDIYAVQKAFVPIADRLAAITGPCHVGPMADIESSAVARLIDCARQLTHIVVIDVPSSLDEWQMQVLDSCDEVVLVGEQMVPSLQLMIESLRLGIRSHAPRIVINRFDATLEGLDSAHLKRVLGVDELVTIAADREGMIHSINRGQPLRLISPRSPALKDIDYLALKLLGKRVDLGNQQHKADLRHLVAHALGMG